jgi:carbamoyl-phosphate synthase large subunit
MRILTEASGSMTSGYMQKKIQTAGYISVGSDINPLNSAHCLSNDFVEVPKCDDEMLWVKIEKILKEKKIDIVIPSLDETLLGWSERKEFFKKKGIDIIISDPATIQLFQDKWLTYKTFVENDLPTPRSSLECIYPLVKPRFGRGSQGILINETPEIMEGNISQEMIEGKEYTIDCFYDYENNPAYIIPRIRIDVKDGKSTKGEVVNHTEIESYIKEFSRKIKFIGPINYQCFVTLKNKIKFIEINPRVAGGMVLGIEASENWVSLIIDNILLKKRIIPKKIKYGLKMVRYYAECFIS